VDIGILALQGDVAEHSAALSEIGVAPRRVRRPDDLTGLDGIILPGGESTTMSMLLESSGLADPLGKELAAGLPALGTCAGMILLSTHAVDGRSDQRCFGAIDLTVRRNGFGRQLESFECDLDVRGLSGAPLRAVFIRAPLVEASGPAVEVLATLEQPVGAHGGVGGAPFGDGRVVPVLCRQGAVLVTAFHPELTPDRRVHELFVSMVEDDRVKRTEVPRTEEGR
jgi:5'-phosphate synthase pdxT subunit